MSDNAPVRNDFECHTVILTMNRTQLGQSRGGFRPLFDATKSDEDVGFVDTASESEGVVGLKWFERYQSKVKQLGLKSTRLDTNDAIYHFGEGSARPIATWSIPFIKYTNGWKGSRIIDHLEVDVLKGYLPLLLGQQFARKHQVVTRGATSEIYYEKDGKLVLPPQFRIRESQLMGLKLLSGE